MVSAFASEARLVLAQEKVAEKSNEITAIPNLIDMLDVTDSIITINGVRDFSRPNTIMGCGSRRSPRVNVTCHFGHSKSMI